MVLYACYYYGFIVNLGSFCYRQLDWFFNHPSAINTIKDGQNLLQNGTGKPFYGLYTTITMSLYRAKLQEFELPAEHEHRDKIWWFSE